MKLELVCVDDWFRAVFRDGLGRYYKSIALAPDGPVGKWTAEEKHDLIATLHDTDDIYGEPGYPVTERNIRINWPE